MQNAVEAYEKLREADPEDREAVEKLKELYTKRRAYRQLYELYEGEAKRADAAPSGARSGWRWRRWPSERLDRGADASRLYKLILAEDPDDAVALDALEKQAERDKDFATVAEVLERRVELADDAAAKLVVLQKLGSVYADRLQDHAGALRVVASRPRALAGPREGAAHPARELPRDRRLRRAHRALRAVERLGGARRGALGARPTARPIRRSKVDLSFRVADDLRGEAEGARARVPRLRARALRAARTITAPRPRSSRSTRRDEKWARLPALYEVLLAHSRAATAEQRALYKKLANVTGDRLADKRGGVPLRAKAYELAPDRDRRARDARGMGAGFRRLGGFVDAIQARSECRGCATRRATRRCG